MRHATMMELHMYNRMSPRNKYRKYSIRGSLKWQIQCKAKPSAVSAARPHTECCIFLCIANKWYFNCIVLHGEDYPQDYQQ